MRSVPPLTRPTAAAAAAAARLLVDEQRGLVLLVERHSEAFVRGREGDVTRVLTGHGLVALWVGHPSTQHRNKRVSTSNQPRQDKWTYPGVATVGGVPEVALNAERTQITSSGPAVGGVDPAQRQHTQVRVAQVQSAGPRVTAVPSAVETDA